MSLIRERVAEVAKAELERRKRARERAELLRTDLGAFVREAWAIVEPAKPLIDNWHIDAICRHLEAVASGQIRWLLINIGPGYAKSLLASVCFSAWLWTRDPRIRILAGTYATILTERDNIKTRTLVESQWYQESFVQGLPTDEKWKLIKRNENHLQNDKTGFRIALSVDSVGTGLRGSGQILDDVLNAKEAHSEASRQAARRWVFETMSSRFDDMRTGWRVAIGQRLHEKDPYGEMLATGQYEHLCLPSEFDPKRRSVTSIGFSDPRQQEGELLFPELFTREVIQQAKKDLGSYGYSGQHQQRPSPEEGGMFRRSWWRYWRPKGVEMPDVVVRLADGSYKSIAPIELPDSLLLAQSWDMAFKETDTSDFVVGQLIGKKNADFFLIDMVRGRMDFPATLEAFKTFTAKHPKASAKYIEDKANGSGIISMVQRTVYGVVAVNPEGGKEARAAAVSPVVEAGNAYLPHPALFPWVQDFIDELAQFPTGANDDITDSFSQGVLQMTKRQVRVTVI